MGITKRKNGIIVNNLERDVWDFYIGDKPFVLIKLDDKEDIILSGDSNVVDFFSWHSQFLEFRKHGVTNGDLDLNRYASYRGFWTAGEYVNILPGLA